MMKEEEHSLLAKAIAVAAYAHDGQVDKQDVPYIFHPLRVMEQVRQWREGTASLELQEMLVAAVLHDVVEDTAVTLDEITTVFGSEVAYLVDLLTHREHEPNDDYIHRVASDARTRIIKRADMMDNRRRMSDLDSETRKRLRAKYDRAGWIIDGVEAGFTFKERLETAP